MSIHTTTTTTHRRTARTARAALLALAVTATSAACSRSNAAPSPVGQSTITPGAPGMPVMSGFVPGQAVEVLSGGTWYPSRVLAVLPLGSYRIHFEGWADRWDENVPPARIRPAGAGPIVAAPIRPTSSVTDPGGIPVLPTTPLLAAQPCVVRWGSSWYNARVIAPLPDGAVRIHYEGWSDTSDENVSRDRMRLATRVQ